MANEHKSRIGDNQSRWARVGPYYAMFPFSYAERTIEEYTKPGDAVLDPFAGRFSSVAAASYLGRHGCGVEISPLGWLYGRVKINPARRCGDVLRRLDDMCDIASEYKSDARDMGEFFHLCFHPEVRRFLLACRDKLNWDNSIVDGTLMAIVLVNLHHGIGRGLSNQMRQAKSMSPRYSINWWKQNGFAAPPKINPKTFMQKRIFWRYEKGVPLDENSHAFLGDSCKLLKGGVKKWAGKRDRKIRLLFTSPPYSSMANYFKDQWLRLWLLDGDDAPAWNNHQFKNNFAHKQKYRDLLQDVFSLCAGMMHRDSTIVVRTDWREDTLNITKEVLQKNFPFHKMRKEKRESLQSRGQTVLFNRSLANRNGDVDIILRPA